MVLLYAIAILTIACTKLTPRCAIVVIGSVSLIDFKHVLVVVFLIRLLRHVWISFLVTEVGAEQVRRLQLIADYQPPYLKAFFSCYAQ